MNRLRLLSVPAFLSFPTALAAVLVVSTGMIAGGCATASSSEGSEFEEPPDAGPRADARPTVTIDASLPADAAPDAAPAAVQCTEDTTIACGDLGEHTLLLADATIGGFTCGSHDTTGVENIYQFTPPDDGTVTITLDVIDDGFFGDDLDIYLLENTCSDLSCISLAAEVGDDVLAFTATGGVTYYIAVEVKTVGLFTFGDYDLSISCL